MRGVASMLAALLTLSVAAGAAMASPAGNGHEAAGEAGSGGGHHWSLADVLLPDSVKDKAFQALGKSAIDKAPVTDVSHVVFAVIVFIILLVMAVLGSYRMKATRGEVLPEKRFSPLAILQVLTDALLYLMEELLGRERALKFLPLIGSLGIFILFSNLMGLIPGFLPSTSNLNTTFALGSVVFVATHYYGVRAHGASYFKHFFGPIFKWYALPLMILMFPIELISHIARPVSLAIRLFGNMYGDHAALSAFLAVGVFGWILTPLLPLPLGTLVCIVQAMVFCILSMVYIHMATEDSEEGEGHH